MDGNNKFRVALYQRVSTDDKGQDPYTQIGIIKEIAERRGYEIVGEFVDYASGKDPNRPQWKNVMQMAYQHKIEGIMALRVDRVMRSVQHLCAVIENLKAYNVALIFSDFQLDPNSPNSMLTVNILSSIQEWERQMISARTREGLAHRKAKGIKLGRKYRDDIPIRDIARLRAEGKGWKAIQKETGIPRSTLAEPNRRKQIDKLEQEIRQAGGSLFGPSVPAPPDPPKPNPMPAPLHPSGPSPRKPGTEYAPFSDTVSDNGGQVQPGDSIYTPDVSANTRFPPPEY